MKNLKIYLIGFLLLSGSVGFAYNMTDNKTNMVTVFQKDSKESVRIGVFCSDFFNEVGKVFSKVSGKPEFDELISLYKFEFNKEEYREMIAKNGVAVLNSGQLQEKYGNTKKVLTANVMKNIIFATTSFRKEYLNKILEYFKDQKNRDNFIDLFKTNTPTDFNLSDNFWHSRCKESFNSTYNTFKNDPKSKAIVLSKFPSGNAIVFVKKSNHLLHYLVVFFVIGFIEASSLYADIAVEEGKRDAGSFYFLYGTGLTIMTCYKAIKSWKK